MLFNIVGFGSSSSLAALHLNGGDTDATSDDDTIDVALTGGNNTVSYEPLSVRTGRITRTGGSTVLTVSGLNAVASIGQLTVHGNDGTSDEMVLIGSSGADSITARQSAGLTSVSLSESEPRLPIDFSSVEGLTIYGSSGDDLLLIDEGAAPALIILEDGIVYDGGTGHDTLQLTGTGPLDSSTYTVGPDTTSGRVVHRQGGAVQRVAFTGLEPVIDTTPGPLIVNATAAANAINVSQVTATRGRIEVDQFEQIEFANKTTLTINANAGADTINIAGSAAGFSGSLSVDGGNPADGDRLIVNGSVSTVVVNTTAQQIIGIGPASLDYSRIESLLVNGASSANATPLGLTGATSYAYIPGLTTDTGKFQTPAGTCRVYRHPSQQDDYGHGHWGSC